jgi:hypothetical protein
MPSQPSLFDDSGNAPATDRDETPEYSRARGPNYLFRRAIAVGGVVAVIATAAIVVGRLIGDDSSASSSGAVSEEWNRVVLVDERTGLTTITDEAGEEQAKITTGIRPISDAEVVDSTMVATSPSDVAVVDLDNESVEVFELETSSDGIIRPSGSALTLIANDASALRAIMVHGSTRDLLDTDAMAPSDGVRYDFTLARSDPSGRHVLVTDSGNFQSVLFSFDRDAASFFPGLALAVDETLVVTAQNVGSNATVNVFDHDGELVTSGRTNSVRAAMIVGDGVILVTVDGEIARLSRASGDTESGDTLDIGTIQLGHVSTSGDRLIVIGSTGTAIVDDSGTIVGEYPDTELNDAGLDQFAPRRSTCLILRRSSPGEVMLVELSNGSTIVEAPVSGDLFATADGCTVASQTTAGYDIISADGLVSASVNSDLVAFAPDGKAIVTEQERRLLLAPVSPPAGSDPDGANEPSDAGTDIGKTGRLVSFTQL